MERNKERVVTDVRVEREIEEKNTVGLADRTKKDSGRIVGL